MILCESVIAAAAAAGSFHGAGTGDVTVFAIYSVSYNLQALTCHILFTRLQIFHVPVPVHCILSFLRDSLLIILRIATS